MHVQMTSCKFIYLIVCNCAFNAYMTTTIVATHSLALCALYYPLRLLEIPDQLNANQFFAVFNHSNVLLFGFFSLSLSLLSSLRL